MPYCQWPGLAFFCLLPGSGQLYVSSGNLAPIGCTHIVVWIILLRGPTKPTSWGWRFGVGRFEHQIPEYYVPSEGVRDTLESFRVLLIFHCSNSPAACLGNWSVTQLSWKVLLVKVLKGEFTKTVSTARQKQPRVASKKISILLKILRLDEKRLAIPNFITKLIR